MADLFFSVFVIITIATLGAFIARLCRQPLIPVYILTGVFLGPAVLGLVADKEVIQFFSEAGIAFLLFVVGLELNFKKLKSIGLAATVSGSLQIMLVFGAGFLASIMLGFYYIEAIYIALIIAFSSTLVVVKLLSDEKQIDTLHGRLILGILLVQDVVAVLALPILGSLNNLSLSYLLAVLGRGTLMVLVALLIGRFVFPGLFKYATKTKELFFLLSITALFLFTMMAVNLGLTVAIGGLIAGLTLAPLPYNYEIISKIRPLRDFFATLFFISLGMGLSSLKVGNMLVPIAILLGLVLVFKPVITMLLVNLFGYTNRTSFLTGISIAQISEFSLIIAAQGLALNQLSDSTLMVTIVLSIVSIGVSTYFMQYESRIYNRFKQPLKLLNVFSIKKATPGFEPPARKHDAVIIGYDRIGTIVTENLVKMGKSVFVVDFNPDVIQYLSEKRVPCLLGDITEADTLERINLKKAKLVVSTIPDVASTVLLLKKARKANRKALVFVTATNIENALTLYEHGADYVISPHFLSGKYASLLLKGSLGNIKTLIKTRREHLRELQKRKKIAGH